MIVEPSIEAAAAIRSQILKNDLLTSVFTRIRERLRSTARRVVDDSQVDDVLQEAFVKLWNNRERLADERQIEGTAITTVRNASLDALRRSEVRRHDDIDGNPAAASTIDSGIEASERAEIYDEVTQLIDSRLSPRDRDMLYLRDRDGWEFEDIADRYNTSEATVRVIVSRARKTIREIYRNRIK